MPFCNRRAHIEFTGKNHVIITTSFKQKAFKLDGEFKEIDLISLETLQNTQHNPTFYVAFRKQKFDDMWVGTLQAKTGPESFSFDTVGRVDWKDRNKQTFKLNVWYEA